MDTDQTPVGESGAKESKQITWKNGIPLSKLVTMALFVGLPFVGGYIGYMYAPEKVVEVEKEVVREVVVEKEIEMKNLSRPSKLELRHYNDARDFRFRDWMRESGVLQTLAVKYESWSASRPLYAMLATSTFTLPESPSGATLGCVAEELQRENRGYLFKYYEHVLNEGELLTSFTIDNRTSVRNLPCHIHKRPLRVLGEKMFFYENYSREISQIDLGVSNSVLSVLPYTLGNDLSQFSPEDVEQYVIVSKSDEGDSNVYLLDLRTLAEIPLEFNIDLPEGYSDFVINSQGVKVTAFSAEAIQFMVTPCVDASGSCDWDGAIEVEVPLDI